uniref:TRAF interacting protein with forkhead associated domain n=1 Tax=Serinus canaria TaxID=9135 RepID=A0A8C9N3Q2_SERCA
MSSFEEAETEETVTCLHLTFYHPGQAEKMMFRCLDFCQRQQLRADDTAKFGRDSSLCGYSLVDTRVSRIQFSLFSLAFGFFILSSILARLKDTLGKNRSYPFYHPLNIRMHFSINHAKKTIIITEGRNS